MSTYMVAAGFSEENGDHGRNWGNYPSAVPGRTRSSRLTEATMIDGERFARVRTAIEPRNQAVLEHEVYRSVRDLRALHLFMEHHVWAVWDFMSLLTRLQRDLTCVTLPWAPRPVDPALQRFVNEIKLGEESDVHPDGGWTSHFDLYLAAMEEVGADTGPANRAIEALARSPSPVDGASLAHLASRCGAPPGAVAFVASTFELVGRASTVEVAAAFALGREQLIPEMFEHLLDGTYGRLLSEYLRRHIDLDEDEHGPLARRLVEHLAGDDPHAWQAVEGAALTALGARARLWDSVVAAVEEASATPLDVYYQAPQAIVF
ncbi:MAG: DUF3050 domain-containing protein [Acidimicrobiia bacterium]|nr:DUF3050 domain-containing protein [Acidimicrobiia bacterium]